MTPSQHLHNLHLYTHQLITEHSNIPCPRCHRTGLRKVRVFHFVPFLRLYVLRTCNLCHGHKYMPIKAKEILAKMVDTLEALQHLQQEEAQMVQEIVRWISPHR